MIRTIRSILQFKIQREWLPPKYIWVRPCTRCLILRNIYFVFFFINTITHRLSTKNKRLKSQNSRCMKPKLRCKNQTIIEKRQKNIVRALTTSYLQSCTRAMHYLFILSKTYIHYLLATLSSTELWIK